MSLISQNVAVKRRREGSPQGQDKEDERLLLSPVDEDAKPFSVEETVRSKTKSRRKQKVDVSQMEEGIYLGKKETELKNLERSLFASIYSPVEFGKEDAENGDGKADVSAPLFFVDKSADGGDDMLVYEEDLVSGHENEDEKGIKESKRPAWVDTEEESVNVNLYSKGRLRNMVKNAGEYVIQGDEYVSRLRAQHIKLNPGTDWARAGFDAGNFSDDENSNGDSEVTVVHGYKDAESDDILRSSDDLVLKSGTKLFPGILEYTRVKDANAEEPSNGCINSVQFHRNGQLILTAGLDKGLRFFQVDGKRNAKIQSIFVEDFPIRKASFLPDGSQVILSGRRKHFYSFDLVNAKVDKIGPLIGREEKSLENFEVSPDSSTIAFIGNDGYILLVSPKTKELVGNLKMNGTARSLTFANDGKLLLSTGGDGKIYHWDLRTRKCIHMAVDEGCLTGSALCTSPNSSLLAAGSSSGIVNIYNREDFVSGKHRPLKTVENLTTLINQVKFNHDAQILAIISCMKKSSLKLVHIPSFTVFSNFPAPNSNLGYPRCLDFSPRGGFMAAGNAAGRVLLYKLHHYQNA